MPRIELRTLLPLVAIPLVLATAGKAEAQSKAKAKTKEPAVTIQAGVTFSAAERELIGGWFRERPSGNVKALPPGIRKNLARGKPLPPGIAKQVLPTGLIDRLPPPPHGYERVSLAGKILLVEIATQVIHDVLEDIILG